MEQSAAGLAKAGGALASPIAEARRGGKRNVQQNRFAALTVPNTSRYNTRGYCSGGYSGVAWCGAEGSGAKSVGAAAGRADEALRGW